jgi:beta-glucosidase
MGTGGAGAAGAGGSPTPTDAGGGGARADGATTGGSVGGPFVIPTVTWPSAACQTRTAGLLAMMTKTEKAAQMVMAVNQTSAEIQTLAPGSAFVPGGGTAPGGSSIMAWATAIDGFIGAGLATAHAIPILYGVDAVPGMNAAPGAVIFPHNAGLGCTRDPQLVQEVGRITAIEVAATGMSWTFSPVISVSFDDRWGRVYESFSEDPALAGQMAAAVTMGMQGPTGLGSIKPAIVACAKHWAGDGQATAGTSSKTPGIVDRGDIRIDEAAMRRLGIAPYLPAIQAGLGSIMVSDARWNGASLTSSNRIITQILKTELGFKGFVATDWNAATDSGGGVVNSVNAGVDMLMQPSDWRGSITLIANGVADARIDDAVTRILNVKCEAGLFDFRRDTSLAATVGSAEHRAVGRRAVRESMVLLQNTSRVLPIAKMSTVWVGGTGANDLTRQCGGWTIAWQGSGSQTTGTTIRAAIAKVATVTATMAEADTAVVVLSERAYAEFQGDSATLDTLPPADFTLLDQARAAGKKVVAIVVSGRPVLISSHLAAADAWIAAWLPGTEGDGVADVLFGDYPPTGKLSHSWPRSLDQANVNFGDPGYSPQFALGFGLNY